MTVYSPKHKQMTGAIEKTSSRGAWSQHAVRLNLQAMFIWKAVDGEHANTLLIQNPRLNATSFTTKHMFTCSKLIMQLIAAYIMSRSRCCNALQTKNHNGNMPRSLLAWNTAFPSERESRVRVFNTHCRSGRSNEGLGCVQGRQRIVRTRPTRAQPLQLNWFCYTHNELQSMLL